MAPSAHNYDKFSSKKNMFFIWPGGGFPLFVCGISQKKSTDLHLKKLSKNHHPMFCPLSGPHAWLYLQTYRGKLEFLISYAT